MSELMVDMCSGEDGSSAGLCGEDDGSFFCGSCILFFSHHCKIRFFSA